MTICRSVSIHNPQEANGFVPTGRTESCLKLLVVLMITGLLILPFSFSSNNGRVMITNTGEISTVKITAESGSSADIQAAVNTVAAAGGGTVYVPAGTWNFSLRSSTHGVTVPGGVNIIGMGKGVTILEGGIYIDDLTSTGHAIFFFVNGNGRSTRISGLSIIGWPLNDGTKFGIDGIYMQYAQDFRIDNCLIDNYTGSGVLVDRSKGIIDHCNFNDSFVQQHSGWSWGYGISVAGNITDPNNQNAADWKSLDTFLGKYDTVDYHYGFAYIEDCVFENSRHNIASARGGFYVARYNTFKHPRGGAYMVDIHGNGFAAGQGSEFYNNTIIGDAGGNGHVLRGGASVIYNNTYVNLTSGITLSGDAWDGNYSNPQNIHDTWIWSNTFTNVVIKLQVVVSPPYPGGSSYYTDISPPTTPAPPRMPMTAYPYPHHKTLETTP